MVWCGVVWCDVMQCIDPAYDFVRNVALGEDSAREDRARWRAEQEQEEEQEGEGHEHDEHDDGEDEEGAGSNNSRRGGEGRQPPRCWWAGLQHWSLMGESKSKN
jgi:hypothetical protein